jgi:hypothetical protein
MRSDLQIDSRQANQWARDREGDCRNNDVEHAPDSGVPGDQLPPFGLRVWFPSLRGRYQMVPTNATLPSVTNLSHSNLRAYRANSSLIWEAD